MKSVFPIHTEKSLTELNVTEHGKTADLTELGQSYRAIAKVIKSSHLPTYRALMTEF